MVLSVLFRLPSKSRSSVPLSVTVTNVFTENSSVTNTSVAEAMEKATTGESYVSSYVGMYLLAREVIHQQKQRFLKPGCNISLGIGSHQIINPVDFKELNAQSWVILKILPSSARLFY